jgi:serine/threonine protein kinase
MDIKLENISLNERLVPVICDFGCSRKYYDLEKPLGFTEKYAGPETSDKWKFRGGIFDWRQSDMWSLGLLLYQMAYSKVPDTRPWKTQYKDPFIPFPDYS